MDAEFWTSRWKSNEIGFHQKSVHDLLTKYWGQLGLSPGATVLVPLAGKSLDMVWLAEQGHDVFGIELSELAIDAFFAERGLVPAARPAYGGMLKFGGPYTLFCGDFFAVPPEATSHIGAVYDRAALIALPEDDRAAYARQLIAMMPAKSKLLLVSLEYNAGQMSGPPFPVSRAEIESLYGTSGRLALLEEREVIATHPHFKAKGVTSLREAAYCLERR